VAVRILVWCSFFLIATMTRAQESPITVEPDKSKPAVQPQQPAPAPAEPQQKEERTVLPDAPIPVMPSRQDGPFPCPSGTAKPCPLLGGRVYFPDFAGLTQHDRTLGQSMKNRVLLAGLAANVGAFAWDYATTRACIDRHHGNEANPVLGQTQAQELGVGITLTAVNYLLAAKLKQRGQGNVAFFGLFGLATTHIYFAAHNRAVCHE